MQAREPDEKSHETEVAAGRFAVLPLDGRQPGDRVAVRTPSSRELRLTGEERGRLSSEALSGFGEEPTDV